MTISGRRVDTCDDDLVIGRRVDTCDDDLVIGRRADTVTITNDLFRQTSRDSSWLRRRCGSAVGRRAETCAMTMITTCEETYRMLRLENVPWDLDIECSCKLID